MEKRDPFKYFKTSREIIRLAVMMYVRFPLSLRNVEVTTLGWVDWFNNRRLLGPIGNIPPAEAEDNF